jgi:hypothetical protein
MSYSNNYNITTLSSSILQRTLKGGAVVAPFVLGAPKRGDPLRETCQPGAVLGGVIPTGSSFPLPWSREGCLPPDLGQTIILPLIASTATTYLPDVQEGGVTGSYPLIASTSVIYTPTLVPGGTTASLPLIPAASQIFAPTITSGVDFYTQIVSASNPNNSSSLQVGSLYLDAQTYTTIGALFTDINGGVGGSDAHVEFKRFTTGVSLLTLNNIGTAGPTWRYVTGSNVVVSNSDWYDIYISASGNPATASIRGVYYEI